MDFSNFAQNIQNTLKTLPIMLKGWGGVFLVMIVIYIIIAILNKTSAKKTEN